MQSGEGSAFASQLTLSTRHPQYLLDKDKQPIWAYRL